jgi:hypothetical protein
MSMLTFYINRAGEQFGRTATARLGAGEDRAPTRLRTRLSRRQAAIANPLIDVAARRGMFTGRALGLRQRESDG